MPMLTFLTLPTTMETTSAEMQRMAMVVVLIFVSSLYKFCCVIDVSGKDHRCEKSSCPGANVGKRRTTACSLSEASR